MSAYAHQMEREFSTQTLSSREVSEMGSRYETGFYMTSFTATIFIGSLITVGLLLTTLLIALTVMLQSCESKGSGVVGLSEKIIEDYSNCKTFALQLELNNFELNDIDIPLICKDLDIWYIKEGQYESDLNFTMWIVESYLSSVKRCDDGLDAVLMDIDDIFPSDPDSTNLYRFQNLKCYDCAQKAKNLKAMTILRLYISLQTSGWPMILFSRKLEKERSTITKYLISLGFSGWSSLIIRSKNDETDLQTQGFRIACFISSRMDDAITTWFSPKRIFKIPQPIYYNFHTSINAK